MILRLRSGKFAGEFAKFAGEFAVEFAAKFAADCSAIFTRTGVAGLRIRLGVLGGGIIYCKCRILISTKVFIRFYFST